MKSKHLLLMLLLAFALPWAAMAQQQLMTENFDAMSSIPTEYSASGWYAYNAGSGNNWAINSSGVNSTKCARYSYSSSNPADCYLVSAPFTTSANMTQLNLSLYENTGGWPEVFEAFFVKASDITDLASVATATQYSAIASASYNNTSYAEQTGSNTNSALADQNVRLVIHCTSAKDQFWLGIDDITVTMLTTDPYISLNPASATVITGFTTTLTATYGNITGTPTINYTSSNEGVAKVVGNGTTATVTGMAAGTATITATLNGAASATCAITVEDPSYCTPSFGSNSDCITNITLGDINNTTASTSTNGYGDYTNLSTDLEQNEPATLSLTSGGGSGTHAAAVWIDFNDNYTFDDSERVGTKDDIGASATVTINLTISSDATPGSHRMRVVYQYNVSAANINPCASANYGEGEDYTVTILAANPCQKPEALTANGEPTMDEFSFTIVGGSGVYNIFTKAGDGDWTNWEYEWEETTVNLTGLTPNTDYQVRVQSVCTDMTDPETGNDATSYWTELSFKTAYCLPQDMCEISYMLEAKDYQGTYYGWYYSGIYVKDASTDEELAFLTIPAEESSASGTLAICDGREIRFEWFSANAQNDAILIGNWVIYDINDEEIASGSGPMTSDVNYTMDCTVASCAKPTNLTETQVGTTSAMLSWEGESDSYVLQYRTAAYDMNMGVWHQVGNDFQTTHTLTQYTFDLSEYAGQTGYVAIRHYDVSDMFIVAIDDIEITNAANEVVVSEGFEGGSIPTTWNNIDYDGDGYVWGTNSFGNDLQHGNYCAYSESYVNYVGALFPDNWLVIPNVELGGTLTFYAVGTDVNGFHAENLGVFVATESYEGAEAGEWSADIPVATTSKKLTGLTASTAYDWQVKGICGTEPSNWASSSFTTIAEGFKTFVTAGNWDVADNWFPEGVPAITDEVSITKAANIPAGVLAQAKKTTIETGGSITIKDGGQLKQGSATLKVTLEKEITGYGESTGKDHYYFITAPFNGNTQIGYNAIWNHVLNLNDGDYDFYAFDATEVGEEWQNYEAYNFNMNNGQGYLYANKANKTLEFTGTAVGCINSTSTVDYTYDGESTDPFNGWALVGNPYTCNTYINYVNGETVLAADFYTLNANGDTYVLSESSVALPPLTGAFINYAATGAVQFTTEAPTGAKAGMLNMTLSQGRGSIDQARVRFGQGYNMKHMSFRNNSSIYMPVDGNDYAVVYSEKQGEMPVSFKAEKNGSYSLSFNTENVEFGYLHLIDNLTGNDVDLLETPSYSFEAKTTDYASRFKLVFSANSTVNEESFAFMSDGNLIVNNEGNATLQVIDVNGRILRSESINGSASINMNTVPGVYMIRVINGENVKTQKMVVR